MVRRHLIFVPSLFPHPLEEGARYSGGGDAISILLERGLQLDEAIVPCFLCCLTGGHLVSRGRTHWCFSGKRHAIRSATRPLLAAAERRGDGQTLDERRNPQPCLLPMAKKQKTPSLSSAEFPWTRQAQDGDADPPTRTDRQGDRLTDLGPAAGDEGGCRHASGIRRLRESLLLSSFFGRGRLLATGVSSLARVANRATISLTMTADVCFAPCSD